MAAVNCKHCGQPIEPDPVTNGRTWRHVEPVIDDDRNAPCVRRHAEPSSGISAHCQAINPATGIQCLNFDGNPHVHHFHVDSVRANLAIYWSD